MNDRFLQHIESLHPSFDALLACIPFTFSELPKQLPDAGIYLFTEGDRHLYVGRTNRLRKRLQQHCRPGSPHSSSPFAFRLAREARNIQKASHTPKGSRKQLMEDLAFSAAFGSSKMRISNMHIRVIEESNPFRQALLEIYTAVSLEAPRRPPAFSSSRV